MGDTMKEDSQNIHQRIQSFAADYFSFLARTFPVMCASDEFHFMPRAEEACRFYGYLDSMGKTSIQDCTNRLKAYRRDLDHMLEDPVFRSIDQGKVCQTILEDYIDLYLLKSSLSAMFIEFEYKRSWEHDPLLYLKIGFIGIDHALGKPASSNREQVDRARNRLESVPSLLKNAQRNLGVVPDLYHRSAQQMGEDCSAYLDEIAAAFPEQEGLIKAVAQSAQALVTFREYLENKHPSSENLAAPEVYLEKTLRDHFQVSSDIPEIMDIARTQWDENLRLLEEIESQDGRGKGWLEQYSSISPGELHNMETLELYKSENRRLREHFASQWSGGVEVEAPLHILQTPRYLRSIRGSASFSAAFSGDPREESLFYITTVLSDAADSRRLHDRLHREYLFLTAHETFPGHHYLDSIRRSISNPMRRQIESPLFYEGWATYAESLLLETGYVKDTLEKLVFHKRNLWRAARCLVDVGLTAGLMGMEESQRLLVSSGFREGEAASQLKRFRLNPGYQLCYSLGLHEILKLRGSCGTLLGNDRFHQLLLGGGELPFSLIELRLKNLA